MEKGIFAKILNFLSGLLTILSGGTVLIFSILFFHVCDYDLYFNEKIFISFLVSIVSVIVILSFVFCKNDYKFAYKLCVFAIALSLFAVCGLYLMKITGIFDKFESVGAFREFISEFEEYAALVFIFVQFLQVVMLPVPSFILISAGVLLFGPLKCVLFSFLGIYAGTLISFCIGKRYGIKFVRWLVGQEKVDKLLLVLSKNNKALLACMFVFPFFPDDLLCFVAGVSHMNFKEFVIITFIARAISVFFSSYSINNSLIPYNTWWGILIWVLIFVLGVSIVILTSRKLNKQK